MKRTLIRLTQEDELSTAAAIARNWFDTLEGCIRRDDGSWPWKLRETLEDWHETYELIPLRIRVKYDNGEGPSLTKAAHKRIAAQAIDFAHLKVRRAIKEGRLTEDQIRKVLKLRK